MKVTIRKSLIQTPMSIPEMERKLRLSTYESANIRPFNNKRVYKIQKVSSNIFIIKINGSPIFIKLHIEEEQELSILLLTQLDLRQLFFFTCFGIFGISLIFVILHGTMLMPFWMKYIIPVLIVLTTAIISYFALIAVTQKASKKKLTQILRGDLYD